MKATVTFPDVAGKEVVVESPSDDPQAIAGAVYERFVELVGGAPEIDVILTKTGGTVFVGDRVTWQDYGKGTVEYVE